MRHALDPESKTSESVQHTKFESLVNPYNSLVDDYNRSNDQ